MKKLLRATAATVLGLSLTTGIAAAAPSGSISDTGQGSSNHVISRNTTRTHIHNRNNLEVRNSNDQSAYTGDVTSSRNTTSRGEVTSGTASNTTSFEATATVDNSASLAALPDNGGSNNNRTTGTIDTTGQNSTNRISSTNTTNTTVDNTNNLQVSNFNSQHASSGDVTVSRNTNAGSATSGDATNDNTTTIELDVSN